MGYVRTRAVALFLAVLPILTLHVPAESAVSSSWSATQRMVLGDDGGMWQPALDLTTGRAGLEDSQSALVASQEDGTPYFSSRSGELIDLGAVNFDKVVPLSGNFVTKTPAIEGHVYLVRSGTTFAKLKTLRVRPGAGAFSLPTIEIMYATATVELGSSLPRVDSVDLGSASDTTSGSTGNTGSTGGSTSGSTGDGGSTVGITGILKATATRGQVVLTWGAFGGTHDGYYVFRRTEAGTYDMPLSDFPSTALTYTDATAKLGSTYYYLVRTYRNGVYGDSTQELKVTVTAATTPTNSGGGAAGDGLVKRTVKLQVGSTRAQIDGEVKTLDVPPQLVGGRTMVPLRFVAEALGAEVKWDGGESKITLIAGGRTVVLWVDKQTALVAGSEQILDVPPTMVGGRTLVPLRFVGENLGAELMWNGADRSIVLTAMVRPAADSGTGTVSSGGDTTGGSGGGTGGDSGAGDSGGGTPTQPDDQSGKTDNGGLNVNAASVVGSWRCMSYAGAFCPVGWHLTLGADGTYTMGAEKGTWKLLDSSHIKLEGGYPGKWSSGEFTTISGGPHVVFTITIDGWSMYVDFAKDD